MSGPFRSVPPERTGLHTTKSGPVLVRSWSGPVLVRSGPVLVRSGPVRSWSGPVRSGPVRYWSGPFHALNFCGYCTYMYMYIVYSICTVQVRQTWQLPDQYFQCILHRRWKLLRISGHSGGVRRFLKYMHIHNLIIP